MRDKHNRSPLFFACLGQSLDNAEVLLVTLLEMKVPVKEINQVTKRKRSVIHQAASHGFNTIIEKLIEAARAEQDLESLAINVQDSCKGMTPLHRAAVFGHVDCISSLLEAQADATIRDKNGRAALVLAYEQWTLSDSQEFEKSISLLIVADADAARADAELAAICAANGSVPLLRKLSELGADLSRQDQYSWTPQQLARKYRRTEAEEFLKLQAGEAGLLTSRWLVSPETMISDDGRTLTHRSGKRVCYSTNKPIPAWFDKFYFEVTCKSPPATTDKDRECMQPIVAIGICTIDASAINYPGWPSRTRALSAKSWRYYGDNGGLYTSEGNVGYMSKQGIPYKYGRTVGCGVDMEKGIIWFTLDGKPLHVQFENVSGRLFPMIGLRDPMILETNFRVEKLVETIGNGQGDL
ncbi:Arp Ankyrin repeat [Pyrenophora tritici-repentis]|uniref:Arp, Ankyrin repeat protein n=2 Tax=Pyrenophora tritici-repentis TaxID=45151 RepID=A0A2W1EQ54_9PLEO|nr:ankyrin repeat and protein kinase domain containing protein 1 [Pyrenophora tritici-repentis Pt-1C-BFP]KAA8627777.1 ankyrin repeat and protein kinase domain-containing protein 1 [Pyrenophora tritici-repentis]EDU42233.1 ankyrin repeat and protein kinase domain containing protein 1 [Pyrenophora tritici-repentis Pt-1C-BFP]KAF7442191.1 ankyrin repeat and protein kinase domain containing protein [Pyrenophora tritici-repentis]KAF7579448.1 Arp, Ankyrin repeat protein [Pyrenophora tritici-repentis]K